MPDSLDCVFKLIFCTNTFWIADVLTDMEPQMKKKVWKKIAEKNRGNCGNCNTKGKLGNERFFQYLKLCFEISKLKTWL